MRLRLDVATDRGVWAVFNGHGFCIVRDRDRWVRLSPRRELRFRGWILSWITPGQTLAWRKAEAA